MESGLEREREWEKLTPDLWCSILMRLPSLKDVMRWRCSSKSCRQVVDSLLIKDLYLNRLRESSPGIIICTPSSSSTLDNRLDSRLLDISYLLAGGDHRKLIMTLEIPHRDGENEYWLLPSINGLICVSNSVGIILCNPTTGESLALPPSPDVTRNSISALFGFGYSPSTDEYKVVKIIYNSYSSNWQGMVMTVNLAHHSDVESSSSNDDWCSSWRTVQYTLSDDIPAYCHPVYLDGAIYWHMGLGLFSILLFDVRGETFKMIPGPPIGKRRMEKFVKSVDMAVLQGRLCAGRNVFCRREMDEPKKLGVLDMWMMVGEGLWVHHLKIEFEDYLYDIISPSYCIMDFSCIAKDKVIIKHYCYSSGIIYDVKTQVAVTVSGLGWEKNGFNTRVVEESLLSLRV